MQLFYRRSIQTIALLRKMEMELYHYSDYLVTTNIYRPNFMVLQYGSCQKAGKFVMLNAKASVAIFSYPVLV